MSKKVHMFGRRSLDKAELYLQDHPESSLIILKDPRGRLAVCSPHLAQELKVDGFQPLESRE